MRPHRPPGGAEPRPGSVGGVALCQLWRRKVDSRAGTWPARSRKTTRDPSPYPPPAGSRPVLFRGRWRPSAPAHALQAPSRVRRAAPWLAAATSAGHSAANLPDGGEHPLPDLGEVSAPRTRQRSGRFVKSMYIWGPCAGCPPSSSAPHAPSRISRSRGRGGRQISGDVQGGGGGAGPGEVAAIDGRQCASSRNRSRAGQLAVALGGNRCCRTDRGPRKKIAFASHGGLKKDFCGHRWRSFLRASGGEGWDSSIRKLVGAARPHALRLLFVQTKSNQKIAKTGGFGFRMCLICFAPVARLVGLNWCWPLTWTSASVWECSYGSANTWGNRLRCLSDMHRRKGYGLLLGGLGESVIGRSPLMALPL